MLPKMDIENKDKLKKQLKWFWYIDTDPSNSFPKTKKV